MLPTFPRFTSVATPARPEIHSLLLDRSMVADTQVEIDDRQIVTLLHGSREGFGAG